VFLAVVLDAYSRKVGGLGAKSDDDQPAGHRGPGDGDCGTAATRWGWCITRTVACSTLVNNTWPLLEQHQMIASMSRAGEPYDNAKVSMSFMRTLKREEIYVTKYLTWSICASNLGEFIEQYYNRKRLHSALGYRSREEFEQALAEQTEN